MEKRLPTILGLPPAKHQCAESTNPPVSLTKMFTSCSTEIGTSDSKRSNDSMSHQNAPAYTMPHVHTSLATNRTTFGTIASNGYTDSTAKTCPPAYTMPHVHTSLATIMSSSLQSPKKMATRKLPVVDNYPERKREALDHMASFRKGSRKLDHDTITYIGSLLAVASGNDNALMVSGNVAVTRCYEKRVRSATNNNPTKHIAPGFTLRKQSKRNYRPAPETTIYPPDVRGQGDWPRVNHYHDESFHQSHFTPQQWETRLNGTNRGNDCLFCTGAHFSDCPLYPTAKLRAAVFRKHHRCICCRGFHYPLPCSTILQKNICTFKQCQNNGLLHDRLFCEVTKRERERVKLMDMHVGDAVHHQAPTN